MQERLFGEECKSGGNRHVSGRMECKGEWLRGETERDFRRCGKSEASVNVFMENMI